MSWAMGISWNSRMFLRYLLINRFLRDSKKDLRAHGVSPSPYLFCRLLRQSLNYFLECAQGSNLNIFLVAALLAALSDDLVILVLNFVALLDDLVIRQSIHDFKNIP